MNEKQTEKVVRILMRTGVVLYEEIEEPMRYPVKTYMVLHSMLWNWIARDPYAHKTQWVGFDVWREYNHGNYPHNDCFVCEYIKSHNIRCFYCPVGQQCQSLYIHRYKNNRYGVQSDYISGSEHKMDYVPSEEELINVSDVALKIADCWAYTPKQIINGDYKWNF